MKEVKGLNRYMLGFSLIGIIFLSMGTTIAFANNVTEKALRDVTKNYQIKKSGYRYDRQNDQFVQLVTLSEPQGKPIPNGLQLRLAGLSQDVSLSSNFSTSEIINQNKRIFELDVNPAINTKAQTNKSKTTLLLRFTNPKQEPLRYQLHVMKKSD